MARCIRKLLLQRVHKGEKAEREVDSPRLTLCEELLTSRASFDLVAFDEALEELARRDRVQAHIVELRFFGGLTNEETAEVLRTTAASVEGEWRFAKLWLRERLEGGSP